MDARRQKAHEIADRARIEYRDDCYYVPSQSGNGTYTVILDGTGSLCDCPDFELRGRPCKHILGVKLYVDRQARGVEQNTTNLDPSPKLPRKTYPQDWPNYNAAQVNEQGHFQNLLVDLCRGVPQPPHVGRGRLPIPLADQVYAAAMKVYSLFSARRFMGMLEKAVERGHVSNGMHFNSVLNALENKALTPAL
jgi:SWIM zinc finger